MVLACSALNRSYRDELSRGLSIQFIWINLSRELAIERVSGRRDHFMPASLVESQLKAAEVPGEAIFLSAAEPVASSIQRCLEALDEFIAEH